MASSMISKTAIKTNDHNKMWGKSTKAHKSLGLTLSITGDTEPIRVCKTNESDSHYVILSGHSRFELAQGPEVECKYLGVLNEEQQVLRLIAYNAGHSTDRGKLTAAARYCHKHFPNIPIASIMDAAGVDEERTLWEEALKLSVKAVEESRPNNRARSAAGMDKSATIGGPKAVIETANKSLAKSGTKIASSENASSTKSDDNSIGNNELSAKIDKSSDEEFSDRPSDSEEEGSRQASGSGESVGIVKISVSDAKVLSRIVGAASKNSPTPARILEAIRLIHVFANGEQADGPTIEELETKLLSTERLLKLANNNLEAGLKSSDTAYEGIRLLLDESRERYIACGGTQDAFVLSEKICDVFKAANWEGPDFSKANIQAELDAKNAHQEVPF